MSAALVEIDELRRLLVAAQKIARLVGDEEVLAHLAGARSHVEGVRAALTGEYPAPSPDAADNRPYVTSDLEGLAAREANA